MSDVIVDKRPQGGGSHVNRGKFMERVKPLINDAVKKKFHTGSITDSHDGGVDIIIPKKGIREPFFRHGKGGKRERVYPGNDRWNPRDKIERPDGGGSGQGNGEASEDGEGEDGFSFQLTRKEFLEALLDGLGLPNLVKTELASNIEEYKWVRAGVTTVGPPGNIHLLRSYLNSLGRRLVFGKKEKREFLRELEKELALLLEKDARDEEDNLRISSLEEEIVRMKKKLAGIPFLDTNDLRFKQFAKEPQPIARAVMFCIMDVSGSMSESRKETAKYFFVLLYHFLKHYYPTVEVVFISHHSTAKEVDEKTFFESTETGGTVVSSALILMRDIMRERYSESSWNIYGAQASDGENWSGDSASCETLLKDDILPLVRYFAYVQIEQAKKDELWYRYLHLFEHGKVQDRFAMKFIADLKDIYPVFHELFKKENS
jgi:uncharacterized sporulation protein YeaH/YhbH (DUF444 family)